ncbi:MAG: polymer-forming cytoskeletal protein [Burkholderiaceae bacterium]|nr:polymer-forming cytoskeletal protein [Burkholderiaceae bacterium]
MFGSKKAGTSTIDCLIGAGTSIDGDIRFSGGLRIDGSVNGRIHAEEGAPSTLVVSDNARIRGEIRAAHIVVNGLVEGPIQADELLELQPSARVVGDVRYAAMEIQNGATVDGAMTHLDTVSSGAGDRSALKLASTQE